MSSEFSDSTGSRNSIERGAGNRYPVDWVELNIPEESTIFFAGLGSDLRNVSVYALFASLLLMAAFLWWFGFSWPLLGGYAVVAALATLSVPVLYRLRGFALNDELEWLEKREAAEHDEMLARLKTLRGELAELGIDDGVHQANTLTDILDDYHAVVEARFIGRKNSPLAYLSAARSVQKHAVQNLNDVVAVALSLSSISRQGDSDRSRDQLREQQDRLQALLDENQQMFDALTDTAIEVANIKSFNEYERIDTLSRLVSLAEIARHT